jgi:hypothetical protein
MEFIRMLASPKNLSSSRYAPRTSQKRLTPSSSPDDGCHLSDHQSDKEKKFAGVSWRDTTPQSIDVALVVTTEGEDSDGRHRYGGGTGNLQDPQLIHLTLGLGTNTAVRYPLDPDGVTATA